MKYKDLGLPYFLTIAPTTCQIKSLSLHSSPLLNKYYFVVQTLAIQTGLPSHYVYQSHTVWL